MELFWDFFDSWEQAEKVWDERAQIAAAQYPLDKPLINPSIPQITSETARFLSFKGFSWVIRHDVSGELRRFFLRHPVKYLSRYTQSLLRRKSYAREGDFFYYGVNNLHHMHELMKQEDTLLIVGFSYCEKPKECPAVRFSNACIADENHLVCQQCFIGKIRHALPMARTIFSIVPTVNAIAEEVVRAITKFPNKKILFLIASCEMALTMFGDLSVMAGIQGIGVKLEGRICNTMQAFSLSEKGIKPGLTWLSASTERKILDLLRFWKDRLGIVQ